jgi:tetratricopeptide (TPR) repeat protein
VPSGHLKRSIVSTFSAQAHTPVDISIDDGDVLPRLFARVWRKLDSDERNLLTVLSTLRISAPLDAFDEQIIKSLTTRNLVEVDQRGGCKLKWQLRTVIDTYITPDKYKAANMIASSIFAARGQYTEAAKHLISADANEKAVECWYAMRHSEIAQGNAKRALVMFDAVNIDHLTDKHAEVLRLLISELRALQGDPVGAINLLNTRNDNHIGITRVLNLRMVGELDHRIGADAAAERAYSDALSALEVPSLLDATTRCGLAWTQRAQGNSEKAWREARFAQCEIELTLGFLRFDQVRYQEAQAHFDIALAIAHDCGYSLGEAKSLDYAAQLSAAQGKHNDAFARWNQATKYYLHCGNLYRLACVRSNQAASLIDLGEYERSVMLASEALHELRLIGAKRAEIGTWQVLAEAQLACNNLDQAEQAARHVIESNQVEYIRHAMLTLAKVMLERQHVSDAEALCRQIADDNESKHHPRLHAHALALLERIRTHGTKMRAAN